MYVRKGGVEKLFFFLACHPLCQTSPRRESRNNMMPVVLWVERLVKDCLETV